MRTRCKPPGKGIDGLALHFVRGAEAVQVEILSPGLAELRQGLLKSVRIRILGGEIGDFRYTNPGLPLRTLDVTFGDLVVDVARLDEGELAPARMGAVTLAELVLDARAHSTTHWNGGTTIKKPACALRARCDPAEWLGRPTAEATLRLWCSGSLEEGLGQSLVRADEPACVRLASSCGASSPTCLALIFTRDRSGQVQWEEYVLGTLRLEGEQLRLGTR